MFDCRTRRLRRPRRPRARTARSRRLSVQRAFVRMLFALIPFVSASAAMAQLPPLPPGGTTSWEVRVPAEIVTFALFDPQAPGVALPDGLRFIRADEIQNPNLREPLEAHLAEHPDQAEWAFSILEIVRMEDLLIDDRAPVMPENGAVGVWFAPVDPSELVDAMAGGSLPEAIGAAKAGSVLTLGFWIPDREYVSYMLEKGEFAEYGMVTLVEDETGAFHGEIRLDDLHVESSAQPHGEVRQDPRSWTQLLFPPGDEAERAVILSASTPHHRTCDGKWSIEGKHPLAGAVLFGPTFLTAYETPTKARGYRLRERARH